MEREIDPRYAVRRTPEQEPRSPEVQPMSRCDEIVETLVEDPRAKKLLRRITEVFNRKTDLCNWFFTPNVFLGGKTPAELIEQKEFKEVLEALNR